MATTNINVRVDAELKKSAEALFNDLGLNMSTAITMFLKSAVNHDGIPFEIRRQTPNAETKGGRIQDGPRMCVYGGHLQKYEKILTFRSPVGRDRRSASRTEPEER